MENLTRKAGSRTYITDEGKKYLCSIYEEGINIAQVARDLNVAFNTIYKFYDNKFGIKRKIFKIDENIKNKIYELYKQGFGSPSISKQLNIAKPTVLKYLNEKGMVDKKRTSRKYFFNEDFFENIDTEVKAYFLGLLFADGYNNEEESKVSLGLIDKDKHILQRFQKEIGHNGELYFKERSLKNPNWQDINTLSLNSKKLSSDLAKLGCTQKKTFIIKYPELREDLNRHFIRGYFDGDGWSDFDKKGVLRFEMVGTKEFLTTVQEILIKDLDLSKTKLHQRHINRDNNIRRLTYGGKYLKDLLPPYLYKDSTISLDRKRNKIY